MCRNIRPLNNFEPPASRDEVTAAALQYVRKVAGVTKPSQANQAAFDRAVALAQGLLSGGPEGARETLETVWTQTGKNGTPGAMVSGSSDAPAVGKVPSRSDPARSPAMSSMSPPFGRVRTSGACALPRERGRRHHPPAGPQRRQ